MTEPEPKPAPEPEPVVEPTPAKEPERKVEFIETRVEKIQGPKIMGKIELPVEKEKTKESSKKQDNASAEDKKKKKRKRILKQAGVKSNFKDEKKAKNEPERTEISPEDIQRRIKETKQRLEPTGKTKASKRRKKPPKR